MPAKIQDTLTVNGSHTSKRTHDSIDAPDFSSRLDEFRAIQDGWLDGGGTAPSPRSLDWLSGSLKDYYADDSPMPHIYPTPEGGVSLEWAIGPHRASLEIDLDVHEAEWHCLDLSAGESYGRNLQLDAPQDWQWLASELRRLGNPTT